MDKNLSILYCVFDDIHRVLSINRFLNRLSKVGKTEGVDDVPFRVNGEIQDKRTVISLRRFNSEKSVA